MNKCWGDGYCLKPITHNIRAPDGKIISRACEKHAKETVEEYRTKLGQKWTAEPIGR